MEQPHIFMSHSSVNKNFTDALVTGLRQAGADVWYDEHNLGAGLLLDEIPRELKTRPIFVVVLSKAAFASAWVRDECRWAYNLYKRDRSRILLPVVAESIRPEYFDELLFLEDFKRVEAGGGQPCSNEEAIERILHLLALTTPESLAAKTQAAANDSVEDLITVGKALVAQRQLAHACSLLEHIITISPRNLDAWAMLGFARAALGRFEDALKADEQALAIDSEVGWLWHNRGNALIRIHRNEDAVAAFKRAHELDPSDTSSLTNLGVALIALHRHEEALEAFMEAAALDQNDASIWNNIGSALDILDRHEEALEAHLQAIAIEPALDVAWIGVGNAYSAMQRYEQALTSYEKALSLNAKSAIACTGKGKTLLFLHRYEESLASFDQALAIDSTYGQAWTGKAIVLFELGRPIQAEVIARLARERGYIVDES